MLVCGFVLWEFFGRDANKTRAFTALVQVFSFLLLFCSCGFVVMGLETASPNDGSVGRDGDRVGGAPREMARCWFFDFGAL